MNYKLGNISNSQNGEVFFRNGDAPCICSGGNGHDATIPKFIEIYEAHIAPAAKK